MSIVLSQASSGAEFVSDFLNRHGWPAMMLCFFVYCAFRICKWGSPRVDRFLTEHTTLVNKLTDHLDEHGNEIKSVKETTDDIHAHLLDNKDSFLCRRGEK